VIFLETAGQERSHAISVWKMIHDLKKKECLDFEALSFEAEFPVVQGCTADNLKAAMAGENHEAECMYPEFADVAEKEGHADIALRLRAIGRAENHHENKYQDLLALIESGTVFKEKKSTRWVCRERGHEHEDNEPPGKCPSCEHPRSYFQRRCVDL